MFINKEKNPTQVGKVNSSDMQTKPSRSNNKWFSVNHIGLKKNQSDKNKIFIILNQQENYLLEMLNLIFIKLVI